MIQRVAVIGAGRLAWSLIPNLQKAGIEVFQLISSRRESLDHYQNSYNIPQTSTSLQELDLGVDLVFLTVRDGAIQEVADELGKSMEKRSNVPLKSPIIVHSSGSISVEVLKNIKAPIGVFYPLQIFTKDTVTDFQETPLFIEGKGDVAEGLLELGRKMSPKVYPMHSEDRLRMHMGAVLACNFPNYLFKLAQEQLPQQEGLTLNIYAPLIRNTVEKALEAGPQNTQTGPAVRGDQETIDKHLELLSHSPDIHHLYLFLSQLINPGIQSSDSFVDSDSGA